MPKPTKSGELIVIRQEALEAIEIRQVELEIIKIRRGE